MSTASQTQSVVLSTIDSPKAGEDDASPQVATPLVPARRAISHPRSSGVIALRENCPQAVATLIGLIRKLPEQLLWDLAFVGGDIKAFDLLIEQMAVPLEELVELNDWFPERVRAKIASGDLPAKRRLVFVLFLKIYRLGHHAGVIDFGAVMEHSVIGTIEEQLPTIKERLTNQLRLVAPEAQELLALESTLPPELEEPKEDTSRYFEQCWPWYVRWFRAVERHLR